MKPGDPLQPKEYYLHSILVTIRMDKPCTDSEASNAVKRRLGLSDDSASWVDFSFVDVGWPNVD